MDVEHRARVRPQGADDIRAECDVRHKMPVHHIQMHPVGAGGDHMVHLVAELGEVGGEHRGGDDQGAGHFGLREAIFLPA